MNDKLNREELYRKDFQIVALRQILSSVTQIIQEESTELEVEEICRLSRCGIDLAITLTSISSKDFNKYSNLGLIINRGYCDDEDFDDEDFDDEDFDDEDFDDFEKINY